MKLLIKNTLTILLTLLVIYGGAGVNLFTYCCNDCRNEGLSVILEEKCCDVHEHYHPSGMEPHAHATCGTSCRAPQTDHSLRNADEENCDIYRINTQWEIAYNVEFDLEPTSTLLPSYLIAQLANLDEPEVKRICHNHCGHGPPVQPPRSYLALLTTLLI